MAVVEAQILLTVLAAYVSKLGALAPARLGLCFSALDVYMTRRNEGSISTAPTTTLDVWIRRALFLKRLRNMGVEAMRVFGR